MLGRHECEFNTTLCSKNLGMDSSPPGVLFTWRLRRAIRGTSSKWWPTSMSVVGIGILCTLLSSSATYPSSQLIIFSVSISNWWGINSSKQKLCKPMCSRAQSSSSLLFYLKLPFVIFPIEQQAYQKHIQLLCAAENGRNCNCLCSFCSDCPTHWSTTWPWKMNSNRHCRQKGRTHFVISRLQVWHVDH
jgi:hypothetical protein